MTKSERAELRKEYSRLRAIAQKRSARLRESGLPGAKDFAKLADVTNLRRALKRVREFLASPASTVTGARIIQEEREAKKREQKRIRREKRALQRHFPESYTERHKKWATSMYFKLQGLGVQINPADIAAWVDYLAMRFEQKSQDAYYTLTEWADEFIDELKTRERSARQVLEDFAAFRDEQNALRELKDSSSRGYSSSEMDAIWEAFRRGGVLQAI